VIRYQTLNTTSKHRVSPVPSVKRCWSKVFGETYHAFYTLAAAANAANATACTLEPVRPISTLAAWRPTRRNVLDPNSLGFYVAGGSYNLIYPLRTVAAKKKPNAASARDAGHSCRRRRGPCSARRYNVVFVSAECDFQRRDGGLVAAAEVAGRKFCFGL
jgi:hypothetical protein